MKIRMSELRKLIKEAKKLYKKDIHTILKEALDRDLSYAASPEDLLLGYENECSEFIKGDYIIEPDDALDLIAKKINAFEEIESKYGIDNSSSWPEFFSALAKPYLGKIISDENKLWVDPYSEPGEDRVVKDDFEAIFNDPDDHTRFVFQTTRNGKESQYPPPVY